MYTSLGLRLFLKIFLNVFSMVLPDSSGIMSWFVVSFATDEMVFEVLSENGAPMSSS